jgi:hypothetical protein
LETPVIHINLTSLAVILWSGFLIVAGSVLILSSQVRHLVEVLESRPAGAPAPSPVPASNARAVAATDSPRTARNAGTRGGPRSTRRGAVSTR